MPPSCSPLTHLRLYKKNWEKVVLSFQLAGEQLGNRRCVDRHGVNNYDLRLPPVGEAKRLLGRQGYFTRALAQVRPRPASVITSRPIGQEGNHSLICATYLWFRMYAHSRSIGRSVSLLRGRTWSHSELHCRLFLGGMGCPDRAISAICLAAATFIATGEMKSIFQRFTSTFDWYELLECSQVLALCRKMGIVVQPMLQSEL